MRAELFRADAPDEVVASASWFDGQVVPESGDDVLLARVFRATAVSIDDPAMRAPGTSGPVVVEPGDMEWFRAAALVRGRAEGVEVRFATDRPGGWDPAMDPQTYGWAGRKPALPHES
jgi:hypothetical protein